MAEPPATTPPKVVASQQDVLLATKLHMPRPQPGTVPRPRLVDRLDEALARGLVLVCAPAGFGKTSLLADWAHRSPLPVAWLSLDEGDNDPARFWRHVVAALDRTRPGLADRLVPLLGPPAPASFEGLVTALINQLADQPDGEALLVLDDYHLIEARPIHASVGFLLEHRPPGLHLVLTSRADPPLALARLRARGQLAELRAGDLRFTAEEAAALLREAVGPDLPLRQESVAALTERTEGWVAGLQLAGLSLRGQADLGGFLASFSGSHRYVLDFLAEEVLDRQPAEIRGFLLETSALERLSGDLCDAVCGRTDSQALLEQVERANLFLVRLDEVRGWWRYHHLFADLLRARLQQEQPERVPELHASAAAWSEQHGLVDDAVRHALAAGDAVWAARLIEGHFDAMLWRSEDVTFRRWLEALPAELVRSRPRLCLAQAHGALLSGRLEAVEPHLADAERASAAVAEEPYEPSAGRAVSLLANVPAAIALERALRARLYGDAERTAEFGRQALTHMTDADHTLRHFARYSLAVADWLRGRLAEAEQALAGLVAEQLPAGARYLAQLHHDLGQVQRARGHLGAALRTYERALGIASQAGHPLPPAGIAHVDMAEVLYERGELEAALNHATLGVTLSRQLGWARQLGAGLAVLAWIRQAQGDRAGALEAVREAERVPLSPSLVGLLNPLPVV